MYFAINIESGVTKMTTSAIFQFIISMKASVPRIVMTPVKNCVKPIKSPSANWSASAIMRLTVSPWGWESRYFKGSEEIFEKASERRSLTT